MSFVRPEAASALSRWRGVLLSGAVILLGVWWALTSVGAIVWIGAVVALIGGAMLFSSLQRIRFGTDRNGPGVVHIDEGAIGYFGPLTGGDVARSEMTGLALDHASTPPHWILSQPGQGDLMIPLNAAGADKLFDTFSSLPGIRTERMLHEMRNGTDGRVMIWQRNARPSHELLH